MFSFIFRLLSCALAVLPLAADGFVRSAFAGDEGSVQYKVMSGDKLAVTVFGQADLSGEFLIDGGGSILMPLVGSVKVARLTPGEIEKKLIEQLSRGVLNNPSVSVRISEYRPVYVVGDVKVPGGYPFRYGLSVLSVLALAGGPARNLAAQAAASGDYISADERVRVLESARRALLIQSRRLEAMRDLRNTLDLSGLDAVIGSGDDVAKIAKQETEHLKSEIDAYSDQIELLEQQKPRLEKERKATQKQVESETKLLELVDKRLAEYEKTGAIGLARSTVLNDFQKEKSRSETSLARLAADLARVEFSISTVDLQILERKDLFHRKAMEDLSAAMRKLTDNEIELSSARKLRELRGELAGIPLVGRPAQTPNNLIIYRGVEDNQIAIPATPTTPLEPGDILDVRTINPIISDPPPAAAALEFKRSELDLPNSALPGMPMTMPAAIATAAATDPPAYR